MRVQFSVTRSLSKDPNTAEVTISNLSEASRAEFQQRPLRVQIAAGYAGENKLLFVGDVRPGSVSRIAGTDWETKLLLGDGSRAFAEARVNRSYKNGTAVRTILRDAATSMGLKLPKELDESVELKQSLPVGESLTGYTSDELTRLLAPFGYEWSIQNGKLQVLRSAQVLPNEARVVDETEGMLGTPELGTPEKGGKPPTLRLRHLLDGAFAPGQKIKVVSRSVKRGLYKVQQVTHTGDSRGDDWETEIEATPL